MIYSNLNCIYIRIPKTATTSIRSYLGNFDKEIHVFDRKHKIKDPHLTLEQINKIIFSLNNYKQFRKRYDSMFKFGFVRNPYDRMASLYFYNLKNPKNNPYRLSNFNLFLKDFYENKKNNDWFQKRIPQSKWIDGCNFVGRYETIYTDIQIVLKHLNLNFSYNFPKINTSKHKHYSYYYNEESINLVSEIEKETIDKFGYSFETKEKSSIYKDGLLYIDDNRLNDKEREIVKNIFNHLIKIKPGGE